MHYFGSKIKKQEFFWCKQITYPFFCEFFIKNLYNKGITNKVNIDENANPHTIAVANGPQIKDFPAKPLAREKSPALVVNDVIKIGIIRRLAAKIIA